MKTITYYFADGTTNTVEVSDEFYALYEDMEKKEALSNRRYTRRTQSLEKSFDNGWDVEDPILDIAAIYEDKELANKLHAAISLLSPSQQSLLKKVFWEYKTQKEIAEEENVSPVAIHQRLERILARLKKILQLAR